MINRFSTKFLFLATVLLGAFCYLLAAKCNIEGIWLHLIPIVAISVYATIVGFYPKSKRDVSDADNAYYMGFLFTMISLSYALYSIKIDGDTIDVKQLIQSFSVALSATIWGIFLRILISPRRQDIDAEETAARSALEESVLGFSKVLNESTQIVKETYESHVSRFAGVISNASNVIERDINSFNLKITNVFRELINTFEVVIPQTLSRTNDAFLAHSDQLESNISRIQKTVDVQLACIVQTNELFKEHSEYLSTSSQQMINSLDLLTDKISNVKIDKETIESHVKSVFLIYESASKQAADSLKETTSIIRSVIEELTDLPKKIYEVVDMHEEDRQKKDEEIRHFTLNVTDLLNRNIVLFQNLPNILRPILENLEDSKQNLVDLKNISPAIEDVKISIIQELKSSDRQKRDAEIKQFTSNVTDLLYKNINLFENLPSLLDSKLRPVIVNLEDSKQNLIHLKNISPAIEDAKSSLRAAISENTAQSQEILSNIYASEKEILKFLNTNKNPNNTLTQNPPPKSA